MKQSSIKKLTARRRSLALACAGVAASLLAPTLRARDSDSLVLHRFRDLGQNRRIDR